MAKDFDYLLARYHFLDETVDLGETLLLYAEMTPRDTAEPSGGEHHNEGHDNGHEGERYAEGYHGDESDRDRDDRTEYLCQCGGYHLSERVDIVGVNRHDVAMAAAVKIVERQVLHPLKYGAPQAQHGALTDVYHQTVVGIGAHYADEQHSSEFEESLGERFVLWIAHPCERYDVIIDKGAGEKCGGQRGKRCDDDANQYKEDGIFILAQDIFCQAP